jgi:glycosyltransferase involved in cell wall biosynthesis
LYGKGDAPEKTHSTFIGDKEMNILLLNQYALPSGSPGITRHGDLGKVLVKRGHKVTIIASSFDNFTRQIDKNNSRKLERENHSGVDFIWINTTAYTANDSKRVKSMLDYSIKAFLKGLSLENKINVVIASSPHLLTGLTGLLLAIYYRVPLVFEVRDLWPSTLVDLGMVKHHSLLHQALVKLERLLYKHAAKIITVPPLAYKRIEEMIGNSTKCSNIPNGIVDDYPDIDKNTPLTDSLLSILEAEKDRQIIMYTGAHGIANNLHNVLEAIDYLQENNYHVYNQIAIVFIGGGQQRKELIEAAKVKGHTHIYFHPPVKKLLLKQSLAYADILLLHLADAKVFTYGISPNKLYDYLQAAKPILFSSPIEDNIVNQIQAGITFLPGQPKELAQAIDVMLRLSEEEKIAMGYRGKAYVTKFHNWEKLGEEVEKVLLEAVQNEN